MWDAIWNALSVVIAAALGVMGGRFTSRQTTRATEITAAPDSRRVDIEGFEALVRALQAENDRLAERVARLEEWQRQQECATHVHQEWDTLAVTSLRRARIVIPDPPPLTA
jgi:hypothetical protein